jgi:hypothetical protein
VADVYECWKRTSDESLIRWSATVGGSAWASKRKEVVAWLSVLAEWSIHCDGMENEIQVGAGRESLSGASR